MPAEVNSRSFWNLAFAGQQVEVDMSWVGFADFIILGRLLVFISSLVDVASGITVHLPTGDPLPGEEPFLIDSQHDQTDAHATSLAAIARRRRQRDHCRLFIKQSGFEAGLTSGPCSPSAVKVVDSRQAPDAAPSQYLATGRFDETFQGPQRSRQLLPYTWIDVKRTDEIRGSRELAVIESSLTALGIPAVDAATLAQGVLLELIENVAQHGSGSSDRSTPALVGGILLRPSQYDSRADDYDPNMSAFLNWGARCQSSLFRLLVADAGQGLITSLSPYKHDHFEQRAASHGRQISDDQDTVLYALNRWSTSTPAPPRRGAYGLWKVERLLRSYRGSILVSSGSETAGYIFADSPRPITITTTGPTWLPGTAVECNVLTTVPNILEATASTAAETPEIERKRPHLLCTTAGIAPHEGFNRADQRRIQQALQSISDSETAGIVIFADALANPVPLTDADLLGGLGHIFTIASESANPSAVALVFAGVNHKFLSLAVEEFNAQHDVKEFTDVVGIPNPILVIAPHNRHHWLGGSAALRQLLIKLSESSSPRRIQDLFPKESTQALDVRLRQIYDQTALLQPDANNLDLTMRPQDVLDALAKDLEAKIRNVYTRQASPGIERGLFVTPSLRLAKLWSDPNMILANLGSERLAGFLLAALLEKDLGQARHADLLPIIVKTGNAGDRLLQSFSLSLGVSGEYFESLDYLRPELVASSNLGQRPIVLCTDLVSSGFSLHHTILQLQRFGLRPNAIASIIDARDDSESRAQPAEFHFGNLVLPFVSIASISIPTDSITKVPPGAVAIDAVLGSPIRVPQAVPRQLKTQPSYLRALMASNAARLGHIRRPGDRHYSAYVDPTIVFQDTQWAREVLSICGSRISGRHASLFADATPSRRLDILYPVDTGDKIADIAHALAAAVESRNLSVSRISAVERGVRESRWIFPTFIALSEGNPHVVILDSGLTSGNTVQQLTRLAVSAGASAVTAIVLLNGLSNANAADLQQVRAVGRSGSSPEAFQSTDVVPFALYFVATTAANSNSSQRCSICALRNKYIRLPHPLPERLRRHQSWLIESLQVRSKERAFQEEPTDLLGVPIAQDDCIEFLRWKSILRQANSNTTVRAEFVAQLHHVATSAESGAARNALIRLFVAESQWLDMPSLWLPNVRDDIAALAISVLLGSNAMSVDPILRVQAVILLAMVSPDRFASDIASLIFYAQDHDHVISQLLIEAQLLLDPVPDSNSTRVNADVIDTLVEGLTSLDEESSPLKVARWPSLGPIEEIRSLAAIGGRRLTPAPDSAQQAWAALRTYRKAVLDHTYDAAIWRLQLRLENLAKGHAPREPEDARLDWGPCQDFLSQRVLPNLELLRPILLRRSLIRSLPSSELVTWTRVVNGDGYKLLNDLTLRLEKALSLPGNRGLAEVRSLSVLRNDLRWWNQHFLAANVSELGQRRSAFLADIVGQCPAYVIRVIREVFAGAQAPIILEDLTDDDSLQLFCDSVVLRDALSHIRMNAEYRHRAAGSSQEFRIVLARSDSSHITLTVYNTGSIRSSGRQRGLAWTEDELQRFGGSLDEATEIDPPWTYGISISLERWGVVNA